MTNLKILGAALLLFTAFGATAETKTKLYKWVDDKGETHYGEVIPPEYADRNKVQLDKGREVREKKDVVEDQASIDRRRKDKALVNTYSNEKEIDLARDRNLQQVEARINSVQLLIKSAQESLEGYRKEADGLKKAGSAIPDSLKSDITGAENKIAKLKQDLANAEEKAAAVKASFEADKARYRELTGGKP